MAQRLDHYFYSHDEYFKLNDESLEKYEYFQGRVYGMAGGSPEHSIIASNITVALASALRGKPCVVFNSHVHLSIASKDSFNYADVTVVGGQPHYVRGRTNRMLTNPSLVVEVLSPSTEKYDRNTKFRLYKELESFQDYLLIDSQEVYVQHFRKVAAGWLENDYDSLDQTLTLENLGITLSVAELYNHVEFDQNLVGDFVDEPTI